MQFTLTVHRLLKSIEAHTYTKKAVKASYLTEITGALLKTVNKIPPESHRGTGRSAGIPGRQNIYLFSPESAAKLDYRTNYC